MAEVAKYGFIADPDLLEYLLATIRIFYGGESKVMAELISRAATIKASFVAADETDRGKRAALNYGHTFAHAMEAVEGLGELRHGEAVALGMMTAAYVSQELGRLDEDAVELHRRVLEALGLPTTAAVNLDDLEAAWTLDKKYRRGVRFVLLRAIGDPEADVEVPRSALMRALARLRA